MHKSVSYLGYAFCVLKISIYLKIKTNIKLKYLLIVCFCCWNLSAFSSTKTVDLDFYSQKLTIEYPSEIVLPGLLMAEEIGLMDYYKRLEETPYQSFLDYLADFKNSHNLNDWLYYELLDATIDKILLREGPLKKGVTLWFLLTKAGYDTRLSYLDNDIYIYVWSEEDIFETPMIQDQNRKFINLSSINTNKKSPTQLKLLLFRPGTAGSPFSFKMEKLPKLPPVVQPREVLFKIKERPFKITFSMDATLFEIMKNYPAIAEQEYFNIPMSEVTYSSLIPKLKFMVKDKPTSEALSILVAFTRTGFEYKDDKEIFGRSKPMIAEELFHYKYSDCEDRSALFYYLVKEILDLPMLIIAYPDHLTIAVSSDEIQGKAFYFNEMKYYICDPTGPVGSNIIGVPPNGYENISFEVLGGYPK